ncbi:helix-turn-helix domain-containing protein [Rhodospira trueperi]|uniref:AraC family transcriptional regulator, transcriptional activator of the genes for pyochelin and ferripyochelin receptors n=1 Tax=Rhodospira trueperi TaxID=69960 RepID=A0A1G7DHV0_9PROT|nr:AraC family transcriptional regulator [Rhodospira trueperi]SDE51117.1 AraC family transcriptional regulator, transcriptional activator of the genes for pyochelin and ferripyochelin receptors [Rhodospira trueperi]
MQTLTTSGLEIILADDAVANGQCWTTTVSPGLWSGVIMRGEVFCAVDGLGETTTRAGSVITFQKPREVEIHHRSLRTGTLSGVFVRVDEATIADLVGDDGAATFRPALSLTDAPRSDDCPGLRAVAWQMLGCPGATAAQRLFLAAKALEFLASVADGGGRPGVSGWSSGCDLAPRDIGRVMEARDIILADLSAAPSVPDLARRVGLNARKLTRGFDALFGAPVYTFIKSARLDRAKALIESGAMSVAEAAYAIGYHPAHLSTEFRRRFGVAPSQVRRTTRVRGMPPPPKGSGARPAG